VHIVLLVLCFYCFITHTSTDALVHDLRIVNRAVYPLRLYFVVDLVSLWGALSGWVE